MKKLTIPNSVTRSVTQACLKAKKYSPEVLVVAGVIGVGASMIMACKATTKANDILEDTKKAVDAIHTCEDNYKKSLEDETVTAPEYTEDDKKKDLAVTYIQTGVKFAKLYGPSVLVCAASLACILKSHDIMRKRNIALAAAYTAVDTGFKEYRNRVVERFGKEMDQELRYNIKAKEVEERVVDENGNETTTTTTVSTVDPNSYSDYSRFFDESCNGWVKDPEANLTFLKLQQNYANERLQRKGILFLNEVYEMLGIPRTKAGNIVGWVYDEEHPVGDNFVDFGLYNQDSERVRAFVNGYERVILLDFNVDGPILEYI
jgi:hypothetical protein